MPRQPFPPLLKSAGSERERILMSSIRMKKSNTPRSQKPQRRSLPGITQVNIQLPTKLAQKMKQIWHTRHMAEGSDPKLCRIYREAVEYYIQAIDPTTGMLKTPRTAP